MNQPPGWPVGVGLRQYDVLDSTNDEARRLAANGEEGPLWISATRQNAGRGRHGRRWISDPGNLFSTLIIRAPAPQSAQTGFVAGIAAARVLERFIPADLLRMKWPNDILAGDRKIAGILVEHVGHAVIAIGMGMNLASSPPDMNATSIWECTGTAPDSLEVLVLLAREVQEWIGTWKSDGFDAIRTAWISRAAGIGKPVHATNGQTRLTGIFEDLDRDGALVLRDSRGAAHRITAADLYFGA